MSQARSLALGCAAVLSCATLPAAAQLGPNGTQIQTSDYTVDLTQTGLLAGNRVTGLAGAYVALAEGTDGNTQNPATPAVRLPYSFDHVDYDLGFGLTFPSSVQGTDFFNTGENRTDVGRDTEGFVFLNAAANLQVGSWGIGATVDFQTYGLRQEADPVTGVGADELSAQFLTAHVLLSRALAKDQVIVGFGSRITSLDVVRDGNAAQQQNGQLFSTTGNAYEAGILIKPNDLPFRIGGVVRSAVTTGADTQSSVNTVNGNRVIGDPIGDPANALYLPNDVSLPWEVGAGLAVSLGPRPLNPRWIDPAKILADHRRYLDWREAERARRREAAAARAKLRGGDPAAYRAALENDLAAEQYLDEADLEREEKRLHERLKQRYRELSRFYVLITTSLTVTGPVENAVGIESFLRRTVNRSGQRTTFTPRLGVETEIIPAWLKVRAGSYYEPTRFATPEASARLHGTFGLDLKLFPWTVFGLFEDGTEWRAGGSLDASQRYFNWGVSVGVWH